MAKQGAARQKVTFSYVGPEAQTVAVAGDFTAWEQAPIKLKKDKRGVWTKAVMLTVGRHEYRLLVDGQWTDDPQCTTRVPNHVGGENCVCVVGYPPSGASATGAAV